MNIKDIKCKKCIHWKNQQRELNYHSSIGFCTNSKFKFNISDGRLVGVFDRSNLKDVDGNNSHDVETINKGTFKNNHSIYSLTTQDDFGCIFFEPIKSK